MMKEGAVIIDVRTPSEFQMGHANGAKNYPLQTLPAHLQEILSMEKPIIFCCASGNRSGQATRMAKKQGLTCENGGGWKSVQQMLDRMG